MFSLTIMFGKYLGCISFKVSKREVQKIIFKNFNVSHILIKTVQNS